MVSEWVSDRIKGGFYESLAPSRAKPEDILK